MSAPATDDVEFVLLGIPDLNASLRGKALSAQAFESAVRNGAAMTDLLLPLEPLDVPIADYERFGIRSGAADLIVHPDLATIHDLPWRPGRRVCIGPARWPGRRRVAGRSGPRSGRHARRCELSSREVLRGALTQMSEVGYDVVAAVEYE